MLNMNTACRTTKYQMARKIIAFADNNEEFLEYTLNLCRKLNKKILTESNNEEEIVEDSILDKEQLLHTNDTALALYLESNLNVTSYSLISSDSRLRGFKLLPSYSNVQKAMSKCKPENICYSEIEVKVPLQSMLNKTAERLCEAIAEDWSCEDLRNVELFVAIGFDSSANHLNPHQSYANKENINTSSQQSLFVTSCIIQKLQGSNERSWINPTPQSTRFCRPLRISFEKEDNEAILREYDRLNEEIRLLQRHRFETVNEKQVIVKFHVAHSLYDGKCVNCILGNNATNSCPICGISSFQFNNPLQNFEPLHGSLNLGLGLLHCELKAFEYLLHLAYRTTIKEWDRKQALMDKVNKRTERVKERVNAAFGIRADELLQGHGTTNTGNLARKCFADPVKFAQALEIDIVLVKNIALILSLLKCKQELNIDKFRTLCDETYNRHYSKRFYSWARMCPTVHKLLKHSSDIIQSLPLPIAYYSEDASESWHKLYRKNLISHARQTGREDRISDTFNRAVFLTDPLISLIHIENRLKSQPKHPVTEEMANFLKSRESTENEGQDDNRRTDSESNENDSDGWSENDSDDNI